MSFARRKSCKNARFGRAALSKQAKERVEGQGPCDNAIVTETTPFLGWKNLSFRFKGRPDSLLRHFEQKLVRYHSNNRFPLNLRGPAGGINPERGPRKGFWPPRAALGVKSAVWRPKRPTKPFFLTFWAIFEGKKIFPANFPCAISHISGIQTAKRFSNKNIFFPRAN